VSEPAILDIGVEEEFHLVDLESRRIAPRAAELLDVADDDRIVPELQASMVETNTGVWHTLDELREDLVGLRRTLCDAADKVGLGVVAAGSVPLGSLDELERWPGERNDAMFAEYGIVAREQVICGVQTQIGIADRDLAAQVLSRSLPWAPVLLAITASSPYWMETDSGYASFRTQVWGRWPSAGVPSTFGSAAEYDAVVNGLVDSRTILDRGMIYFDGRLSVRFPTIEYRVCDACPDVDDAVLAAGLWRALARTCIDELQADSPPPPPVRRELVAASRWRAARSGLSGELLDPVSSRPVTAAAAVERLVDHVTPALKRADDYDHVTGLLERTLARGGSAQRQRAVVAAGGSLADVVDQLVLETARC
jgi:glutamate---cysteine ligase / carboxylate-amine ligase